ncbi:hypothetical protein HFP71_33120 [Streptomyces sp. ARC32]
MAGVAAVMALTGGAPAATAAGSSPDFDARPPQAGKPFYTEQQLATNGQGGFPNYRILALTGTNDGDVLASYG